jgi:ADP-ribosyl-[dinitrogen reductase] hydrolase
MSDLKPPIRIRGALLGLATGDALGAPVEFNRRDEFPYVTEMQAGGYFRLPSGAWTDDTAMALCLADSLIHNPELDLEDLMDRFIRWVDFAENTSTGKCIGLGQNTFFVLGNYRRTKALVAPPNKGKSDGNGSIMRIAPIPCLYWKYPEIARKLAIKQSYATHASVLAASACDFLSLILCDLIRGVSFEEALSHAAKYEFSPDIRSIALRQWADKKVDEISSSGFVVHTLEAACWCVWNTSSFEDSLIKAVNLGEDADTVAAVTGQIAGAIYGQDAIPDRWLSDLAHKDRIASVADSLISLGDEKIRGLAL